MNQTIANVIADYEIGQLRQLISELEGKVASKEEEPKTIVWRVVDRYSCFGNFSEPDYLKAVDCLKETAAQRWEEQKDMPRKNRSDVSDLTLHIEAEFMPESDAKEYLK